MTKEPIDLEAIEKACEAATPGNKIEAIEGPDRNIFYIGGLSYRQAQLLTACQEWVPALVARVRELEAEAKRLRILLFAAQAQAIPSEARNRPRHSAWLLGQSARRVRAWPTDARPDGTRIF